MAEDPVKLVALEDSITEDLLKPGTACLVKFAENTFLVEIAEVTDDTLRVTFYAYDFPVAGMLIDIEFHQPEGIIRYVTKVIEGPKTETDGILLEKPFAPKIVQHRATYRVPTDIPTTFIEDKGRRAENCTVVNLSTTGASLESRTPLSRGDFFALNLKINDQKHTLEGEVCHVAQYRRSDGAPIYVYGTRFTGYSPGAGIAVTNYVWDCLRELYPAVSTD